MQCCNFDRHLCLLMAANSSYPMQGAAAAENVDSTGFCTVGVGCVLAVGCSAAWAGALQLP